MSASERLLVKLLKHEGSLVNLEVFLLVAEGPLKIISFFSFLNFSTVFGKSRNGTESHTSKFKNTCPPLSQATAVVSETRMSLADPRSVCGT